MLCTCIMALITADVADARFFVVSKRITHRSLRQVLAPSRGSLGTGAASTRNGVGSFSRSLAPQSPPQADDVGSVRSHLLLLGQVSPMLSGVKFFSTSEPVQVTAITVNVLAAMPSVDSFLVYDAQDQLLGTATQLSAHAYRTTIATGRLSLPRRQDVSIYVRARLRSHDNGGVSNELIQVGSVEVSGNGEWSNEAYTNVSSDTFPTSRTARGSLTSVTNAGSVEAPLANGSAQLLAQFRFVSARTDASAHVRVTQLQFQIEQTGGVTVSNVSLKTNGIDTTTACTVASTIVTCSAIPTDIGQIDDGKTIRVYGDVSVPNSALNPTLRLALNDPGTVSTAGAITWTDTEATFTWVDVEQPVARGTVFR